MGMKRDFALGDGHNVQYADDVLWSCTLETYFVKQCHHNKLNLILVK